MNSIILIVEDDPDIRDFLQEYLRDHRYTVYVADKGTQAITLVDKVHPDLVILDLGLPDMDGESVCALIKEDYPTLPVLILTASTDSKRW